MHQRQHEVDGGGRVLMHHDSHPCGDADAQCALDDRLRVAEQLLLERFLFQGFGDDLLLDGILV